MKNKSFLIQWVLFSSVGELLGFGFAAFSGFIMASLSGYDENLAQINPVLPVITMVVAGFAEGYILGYIQSIPLHRSFSLLSRKSWALWTAVGGAVAWGAGMLLGPYLSENFFDHVSLGAILVGILFLVVIAGILGLSQWVLLRRHFDDAWKWILYTIIGWGIALVFSFSGTSMIEEDTPIVTTILISLVSGLLMGAVSAFFTGWYLQNKTSAEQS